MFAAEAEIIRSAEHIPSRTEPDCTPVGDVRQRGRLCQWRLSQCFRHMPKPSRQRRPGKDQRKPRRQPVARHIRLQERAAGKNHDCAFGRRDGFKDLFSLDRASSEATKEAPAFHGFEGAGNELFRFYCLAEPEAKARYRELLRANREILRQDKGG
ncbi:hypothetical protein FJV76_01685 [Mesorhizobium sp. WSM4303]|uniref:hypothetical protein n=1 Tax=unclassified Mesorhizobium TaxID=325217 RepID=UPI00115DA547|nr:MULTISPECIES: hypothetical protein [unclassified Mesorhizobium]TRC95496.1 hypothetical protein FJV77_16180 [Mesorhizobium sp. WSM4306]TRD09015.1 hypothetical protein FJV76_01685 [Mesorhizobium sp. WSM4303]